ncbi:MAG: thioredoxin family protein [Elusimicrobia bacterium]|nr:thioredoxin family protein [Elusimicrobiota bacterium]
MLTESKMLPLGTKAPSFELTDTVSGKKIGPETFRDRKALLVMFICQHCPYVQHVKGELSKLGKDYKDKGLGIIAVSANDPEAYPQDAPKELSSFAKKEGFDFPLVFDESQHTAKAYSAVCTPDFFLFGKDRSLVYRGQLDDSRPGNGKPVTGKDLRAAIDSALAGKPADARQKPSAGCSIKWKPGNEPAGR